MFGQSTAGELVGVNSTVEAAYGYDISNGQPLDGWQRAQRGAAGVSSLAGTAAGGISLAAKFPATFPTAAKLAGIGAAGTVGKAPGALRQGSEYVVADAEKASNVNAALRDFYYQHNPGGTIEYANLPNSNGLINPENGNILLDQSLLGKYQNLHEGALNEELWHFYQLKTQGLLGNPLTPAQVQGLETGVKPFILHSGFEELP